MKKDLLKLDLQLFADEEGVNDSDIAEQNEETDNDVDVTEDESVTEDSEDSEESTTEDEQSFKNEQNATYARIRRDAEAKARARYDSEIAQLCNGYVHPVTQKPITSLAEYKDAIYQQDRLAAEEKLKDSGLDMSAIDNLIANNPVILQAQQIISQSHQVEAERRLQTDFEAVKAIDPSIKTMADIPNLDVITSLLQSNNNMSLVDAYKLANYDTLVSNAKSGARQGAINQIRGKAHMTGVESLSSDSTELEIPQAEYKSLKETFPNKSDADLKKLYNKTIKKLGGI